MRQPQFRLFSTFLDTDIGAQQMNQGRTVGYGRVSTDDQNLSLQLDALAQQGVTKEFTFTDKLSGAKDDRPGLRRCLTSLQPGDTLVVWRLTPLFRPTLRRIPFHRHDVAGLGFGIEMQLDTASVELTQDRLDSPLD